MRNISWTGFASTEGGLNPHHDRPLPCASDERLLKLGSAELDEYLAQSQTNYG